MKHFKRFLAVSLILGHGFIHFTLPMADLIIHGAAVLLFIGSFRHHVA